MRLSALLSLIALAAPAAGQGPRLSEFLARNDNGLVDEDGDASDWLEVENVAGAGPLDLGGWRLTDDPLDLAKWVFPNGTTVADGGFRTVFASAKNRVDPTGNLHTNFRLDGSGEYLALVDPSGAIVTEFTPAFPEQFEDISYGFGSGGGVRYFTSPTPGAPNGAGGPPAFEVLHSPHEPTDTDTLLVGVRAPTTTGTPPTVTLEYRVMYGSIQSVAMRDDGVAPDTVAGDELFTAAIPAAASAPGEMVRYRIQVSDALGATTLPPFLAPLGSPEWFGTVVVDPSLAASALPVWQWFVQSPSAALTETGTRASLMVEGRFYDNIKVKRRGATSASFPRKSLKFDFNPDHRPVLAAVGVPIDEANLNSHYSDKAHVRQHLSYEIYESIGSPACVTFPVRLQQNGDFYSIQTYVEEVDRFFLERSGEDPDGALYKMFNTFTSGTSGVEKVTRTYENNNDLQAFVSTVNQGGPGLEAYLFDNLDVPKMLSYLVGTWVIHDNDHVHKNHYLYRDTNGDGEWHFLPWDKDLTFGRLYNGSNGGVLNDGITYDHPHRSHVLMGDRNHTNPGGRWNRLIDAVYSTPRLRAMYLRRLRTVCDELLQPPGTPMTERWMEAQVNALFAEWSPTVALDVARWGLAPWGTPRNFQDAKDRLLTEYVENRRDYFYGPSQAANGGLVPAAGEGRSAIRITGFDPSPGDPSAEYIEVTNDAPAAVDLSGFRLEGAATWTLPQGTVIEGGGRLYLSPEVAAFRARTTAPHGGQGHFVLGPYVGDVAPGMELRLRDEAGRLRARATP